MATRYVDIAESMTHTLLHYHFKAKEYYKPTAKTDVTIALTPLIGRECTLCKSRSKYRCIR